jgi:carbonic anhydrase/acetyltransferase-like protein (isoleucine patch superfamily)
MNSEKVMQKPKIHESVYLAPGSTVTGSVVIGAKCTIWPGAVLRGDEDDIVIGKRSNVQDNAVLHQSIGVPVIVGNDVTIGHLAIVHSAVIGNNVLIGMGAIVLDGAVIEDNVLIGAGALIAPNKRIPSGSLVVGSPGRVIRELTTEEIAGITKNAADYVALGEAYQNLE